MSTLKSYYFTFSMSHFTLNGDNMKSRAVKVDASSYENARSYFIKNFALPFMGRADKWAFQYDQTEFEKILQNWPIKIHAYYIAE